MLLPLSQYLLKYYPQWFWDSDYTKDDLNFILEKFIESVLTSNDNNKQNTFCGRISMFFSSLNSDKTDKTYTRKIRKPIVIGKDGLYKILNLMMKSVDKLLLNPIKKIFYILFTTLY